MAATATRKRTWQDIVARKLKAAIQQAGDELKPVYLEMLLDGKHSSVIECADPRISVIKANLSIDDGFTVRPISAERAAELRKVKTA